MHSALCSALFCCVVLCAVVLVQCNVLILVAFGVLLLVDCVLFGKIWEKWN